MDRSELITHTLNWTWGACVLWNQQAKAFPDLNTEAFLDFVHRTHNCVYKYVSGKITLNGSYSDFEVNSALAARIIFRHLVPVDN